MTCPVFATTNFKYILPIPSGVKLIVEKGKNVKEDDVLYVGDDGRNLKEYDLSETLAIDGEKVGQFLVCSLGSKIEVGQAVAERKPLLGKSKIFKSPISGTLESLTEHGIIRIKESGEAIEVKSPVSGYISQIDEKIILEIEGEELQATLGCGQQGWGIIRVLEDRENKADLFELSSEDKGKILVVGDGLSKGFTSKADALGIVGLVCGKILEDYELDDTIVICAGEKDGLISMEIWNKLKRFEGKKALIFGEEKFLFIPK